MASENIEIELQWFARVRKAQTRYQQAAEHQLRTIEELDKALIKPADSNYAAEQADRKAKLALDEFVRCQETLVKLVLRHTPATPWRH